MIFLNRFNSILKKVEVELATSLPIYNIKQEIVFFYSTTPIGNDHFRVGSIIHIFSRDIDTGVIKELAPNKVIPQSLLDSVNGSIIMPKVWDDEAIAEEDTYESSYEEFISYSYSKELSARQKNSLQLMYSAFEQLIPVGPLRDVYYSLGQQMFEYIGKMI